MTPEEFPSQWWAADATQIRNREVPGDWDPLGKMPLNSGTEKSQGIGTLWARWLSNLELRRSRGWTDATSVFSQYCPRGSPPFGKKQLIERKFSWVMLVCATFTINIQFYLYQNVISKLVLQSITRGLTSKLEQTTKTGK